MISVRHTVVLAAALALPIISVTAVAQQPPYRVSGQQVQDGLNRIDARTGAVSGAAVRATGIGGVR
jgi:hypothetical protein